ncbi:MAG: hypothetical protein A2261_01380 [Candidatus Magasanikbacteria bacterium RIFOXYA2_FULL_44_8]|uniref:Uncharacterized protein n=1 Tax=Candidatus Magasanikbacteria bacterium RIFOXYA2_FULL_44_8 TaxID=1798696 RepID=A0A1F6NL69_9BACT|nr:MAG: hypothetical protein A2261_01380 [Candidatus Magasanikbacteria bacterium RIFOXYA2_FULL_44_8]
MLSPNAQKLIADYLSLPFPGVVGVRTPYFINLRADKRGQIRSLTGKGTPQEIVEEAKIISIQYHHGLFDHDGHCCIHGTYDLCNFGTTVIPTTKEESLSTQLTNRDPSSARTSVGMTTQADCIRKFLIDNKLGIDCSGFITHVLRAHFLETKKIDIAPKIASNIPAGFIRKIIMRLRPVESIGVKSGYWNDKNTIKLGDEKSGYDYAKIAAGDVVVMLETGPNKKRNHILLITDCDGKAIRYVQARAWSCEGQYGHGVNTGEIKITAPGKGLLAQNWIEKSPTLTDDLFNQTCGNETLDEAKNASVLEIRRVKI